MDVTHPRMLLIEHLSYVVLCWRWQYCVQENRQWKNEIQLLPEEGKTLRNDIVSEIGVSKVRNATCDVTKCHSCGTG